LEPTQPDGLIERMQADDLLAFEEFFNTYKRPVYTTALAITRDPFLAEEVLQDCFVKAYRVRDRLQPDRSPLPWLQRVAINLCYSRFSRRKSLAEPITSIISNLVVDLGQRPDQIVESRQAADRGDPLLPAWLLPRGGGRDCGVQRGHHEVAPALRAQGAACPAAGGAAPPGWRTDASGR
jgi:RNA polymerase sigma factor (sigma-70 family)